MSQLTQSEAAILAILREAKTTGVGSLYTTPLHKFVYLLDLYAAEESGGKTFTGEQWRFLHFGPFSPAVALAMENLAGLKLVFREEQKNAEDESVGARFSLWQGEAPQLRELVSKSISLRIDSDLKRFAYNLPGLLNYIYFRTAPMADAKPGNILRFDDCTKVTIADFKPIEMNRIPTSKLKKAREKLRALSKAAPEEARFTPEVGPYDEIFEAGMAALDGEQLPVGAKGQAKIAKD